MEQPQWLAGWPLPSPIRPGTRTFDHETVSLLGRVCRLALTGNATFAADECAKITATGHPQYPVIAYKDGENIAGAAPMLVEAIAKDLKVPLESKFMGSWADAQAAARDGKADYDLRHLL